MITFTGSPPVGWGIRERVPHKRVGLELGNNAPVIIEPSADWEAAADKITVAGTSFAGQSCISVQRVYVHRSIAEGFVARLGEAFGRLVVGDPLDDATQVSALIDHGETERVRSWIDEAVEGGARVVVGGQVGVVGHLRIGRGSQIAGSSNVNRDVPPGSRWGGTPAKPVRAWFRELTTLARLAERSGKGDGGDDT